MAKPGLSRGSIEDQRFIEDSANNYIVEAFIDVSAVAPGSGLPAATNEQQYLVEAGSGSELGGWGTITSNANNAIIKYNSIKAEWQVVFSPAAAEEGATLYDKDSDTIYGFDGADWNIASGAGGGVKNFAQKQSTAYKPLDFTQGNNATFGTAGAFAGAITQETVAPLDGKKSFLYTAAAGSQNDWMYLTVDIDQYARGGAIAFTFDYTWDGADGDIEVQVFDPTFTNEYSTELNTLADTTNDNKLSRNSRTIYAHPDTESQVLVGFHIKGAVSGGEKLTFDNLKVTDDIGVIGSGSARLKQVFRTTFLSNTYQDTTDNMRFPASLTTDSFTGDNILEIVDNVGDSRTEFTATRDCIVDITWGLHSTAINDSPLILVGASFDGRLRGNETHTAGRFVFVSGQVELKAGQFFTCYHTNMVFGNTSELSIVATSEEEEGLRFLSVPNGEKLKDSFSAIIIDTDQPTGTIASTNGNFIQSFTRIATGNYDVVFVPGFFSVPPTITMTAYHDGGVTTTATVSYKAPITTSGFGIYLSSVIGDYDLIGPNEQLSIVAHRQGLDVAPDIVGVPVSIQGQTHEADSAIRLKNLETGGALTGTGTEASNKVLVFRDLYDTYGSAITYEKDLVLGDRFVINETGLYDVSLSTICTVGNQEFGIVKNTPNRTLDIGSMNVSNPLNVLFMDFGATTLLRGSVGGQVRLAKGDVITCQIQSSNMTVNNFNNFTIAKVGTQPLLDGGVVKGPDTSWRMNKPTSFVTGQLLNWDVTTENLGNGVEFDASIGSYRILKDGIYSFTANVQCGQGIGPSILVALNKNNTSGTRAAGNANSLSEEFVEYTQDHNPTVGTAWAGYLVKGETVQIYLSSTFGLNPTPSPDQDYRSHFSVAAVGDIVQYTSKVYKEDPIAWQQKFLSSNATTNGVMSDLTFNNLEIGKTYRISGIARIATTSGFNGDVLVKDGITTIGVLQSEQDSTSMSPSIIFTASATTLTFERSQGGGSIAGNGTKTGTYIQLEELPFHAATSKWS